MKIVAILLVAVVCCQADNEDSLRQKWSKFQTDFGKIYKSPYEAYVRFNIFKNNLKEIDAHNELFEQGEVSYRKSINKFADWTHGRFLRFINGGLISKPTIVGTPFNKSDNFVAPASVDWRTKNVVVTPTDQGGCGAGWAFSAIGAVQSQLALNKKELISLSEQQLVDCSRPQGNQGCNGGSIVNAYKYIEENGIESEADYPYLEQNSECKAEPAKTVTKISGYAQIPSGDEESLVEAIATVGPISVAIDASALSFYGGGIYDDEFCSSTELDHGVLIVGYGSENGTEYYIVQNDWGASWGDNGYFKLLKKNNKCGVATMASYPLL